jgi:hypothetical protein
MRPTPFWARGLYGAVALFLAPFLASSLHACSVCGCGDPLLAAGSTPPMAGQWRFSVEAESLYTTSAGADEGTTEFLAQQTLKPVLAYNPSNSLSLVLQVPLVRKNWWTDDAAEPLQAVDHSGFGDLDLGARWFFWQDIRVAERWSQALALSLGSSLPTGNSELSANGERIDQHAQLGTGAVGPYVGLLYGVDGAAGGLSVNAAYRYRATNAQGYQYGQALVYGLGGHLRVGDRLALNLGLDGRYADYDQDWALGAANQDSGGTVLALSPGFGWQLSETLGLSGRVQVPVYTALFGAQLVTPTVDLSVQYIFQP